MPRQRLRSIHLHVAQLNPSTRPKLAKKFGVGTEAVRNAAIGVTYRHLPMPPKRAQQSGR
jgi:hypothetical protein